jgi:FMN phosphatase YigB (HAD superfamily)
MDSMRWLRQQGYAVICVTNSPAYLAQKRLYQLGLDQYVKALVAWEGIDPAVALTNVYETVDRVRRRTRIREVRTFTAGDGKPSDVPYRTALALTGAAPRDVWVIGDSVHKDLAPAADLGFHTIWAKYGASFDPDGKNERTLLSITNWTQEEVSRAISPPEFAPDVTIERFDQIQSVLPVFQYGLFE